MLIERVKLQQHLQIVETYFQNQCSVRRTFRALQEFYGPNNPPSEQVIHRTIDRLRKTFTLLDETTATTQTTERTTKNIDATNVNVAEESNLSNRRRSRQIGLCPPNTWKILRKDIGLHSNKPQPIQKRNMSLENSKNFPALLERAKKIIPKMTEENHKGDMGRIGIIGGSLEYTGAPYYAGISALKVGADLVHIFCCKDAANAIKSYCPDLIVHPILDKENATENIKSWLERMHVMVIGPGLGRDDCILKVTGEIIKICRSIGKPIIIDADGIHLITQHIELIKDYNNLILTPNAIEFQRFFGKDQNTTSEKINQIGIGVTIIEKSKNDCIHVSLTNEKFKMPHGGSSRRCGGQGDILVGALATFFHWALKTKDPNPSFIASFCASFLVKECNSKTFQKFGRSMVASDMINEIHAVFQENFEITNPPN